MNTSSFLQHAPWQRQLFQGRWTAAPRRLEVREPATGALLDTVAEATPQDVAASAALASAAQESWAATAPRERAAVFLRAADLFERHLDELTLYVARETGAILPKGQHEVREAIAFCRIAAAMPMQAQGQVLPSTADRLSLARRVPMGCIGVISPFNFPLVLTLRVVAPALAVGNAVIIKPDPRTPVSGGALIAEIFARAGLPEGVLHVLPGGAEIGEALVTDPDVQMISFTGSEGVGRRIGALAGEHLKKVSLELGGSNSLVVLGDLGTDEALARAAGCVAWGAWLHQGQICMASNRVFVEENIADHLAALLADKARHLPVGDGAKEAVALGPLIDERQARRVEDAVQASVAAGARLLAGGTRDGRFVAPTVLDGVRPGMRTFDHETFGPVVNLVRFRGDDEAVSLANRNRGSLAAAVIGASTGRAMAVARRLRAGMVHVNDQTVNDDAVNPFGGPGVAGNGNVHGGPGDWECFMTWRWMTVRDALPAYPF